MTESHSVPLAQVVDPVTEIVSAEQVEPDGALVAAADLLGFGELIGSPRRVADSRRVNRLIGFRSGDLLVATTRSAEAKVWLADCEGFCTAASLAVLRPNGRLDSRYLLWWLRARRARLAGGRLELRRERVGLPEQEREVESIVRLLDQLETVTALRRRTREMVGRLEPAMFEDRFGQPLPFESKSRAVVALDAVTELETGWSPQCSDRPASADEWGVIKVSAVSSGRFRPAQNKALPLGVKPREELGLRKGDLLMVRSNTRDLVGATALVTENYPRLLFSDKVWRLRFKQPDIFDSRFLKALLSHPATRLHLSGMATGNLAAMQNLTKVKVEKLLVIAPSFDLQRMYVADLELVEHTERALRRQTAQLDRLLHEVLATVFQALEPPAAEVELVIERALFAELSRLQQSAWRALVGAEGPLSMTELSHLVAHELGALELDRLRRALDLLTAAGVAVRSDAGSLRRWSEAERYDQVTQVAQS